jgi:hypothetical protein
VAKRQKCLFWTELQANGTAFAYQEAQKTIFVAATSLTSLWFPAWRSFQWVSFSVSRPLHLA